MENASNSDRRQLERPPPSSLSPFPPPPTSWLVLNETELKGWIASSWAASDSSGWLDLASAIWVDVAAGWLGSDHEYRRIQIAVKPRQILWTLIGSVGMARNWLGISFKADWIQLNLDGCFVSGWCQFISVHVRFICVSSRSASLSSFASSQLDSRCISFCPVALSGTIPGSLSLLLFSLLLLLLLLLLHLFSLSLSLVERVKKTLHNFAGCAG